MQLTLADIPIPVGENAVAEAGLLAQALMAASPGFAEARYAARQHAPDVPGGAGFLHVILTRHGKPAEDFFIELRGDGAARYHADAGADVRATALNVAADVADLLTSRLRRLADAVAPIADEGFSGPVRNAAEASEAILAHDGTDPALAALADRLMRACLEGASVGSAELQLARAREVAEDAAHQHLAWRLTGWSRAGLLLAVNVPIACAAASRPGQEPAVTFAPYLGTAASSLRSGDWKAASQVVGQALAEGHHTALAGLNEALYGEAVLLRDEALAGPPSPMAFGHKLFEAMPLAFAAWWISRCAENSGTAPSLGPGSDTWPKRRTDAEEVYTRLADGVFAQWWRGLTGALDAERREITATLKAEGKLAADELLRRGENAYLRPRSLRPYLLGEQETPDGS